MTIATTTPAAMTTNAAKTVPVLESRPRMKGVLNDFVPPDKPLPNRNDLGRGEPVNHLHARLEQAWLQENGHVFQIMRMDDSDPMLEDFAQRALEGLSPLHIGVAATREHVWAYVLHRDGVDLLRIISRSVEEQGRNLLGLARRFVPPGRFRYSERLVDLAPEILERNKSIPPGHERIGLVARASGAGLTEPVDLRVWPWDIEAFEQVRTLLRQWAR
jgi:hypothetical protein